MQIEMVAVANLKPSPYNPRTFPPEMLAALVKGLKEFGCVEPVIVNRRSGFVVGGHMRIEAAKTAGLTELPVTYVDLDEAHEKALNVALNQISGEWDFSKLADLMVELDCGDLDMELTGFDEKMREQLATWTPDPGKEYDESIADGVEVCKCPTCGHEHAAKK